MRRFKNRSEATLYLWDYFYVSNAPQLGDESVWKTIENAACRILELESFLRPSASHDEQLRNARRLRRAVRLIVSQLPRLKAEVAPWISEVLGSLEADVSAIIAAPQQNVLRPDRGMS
jgi:hypothetical protein